MQHNQMLLYTYFQNLVPTLPTMQFSHWVTSHESDYMEFPLQPQEALHYFLHIYSCTLEALLTHFNV